MKKVTTIGKAAEKPGKAQEVSIKDKRHTSTRHTPRVRKTTGTVRITSHSPERQQTNNGRRATVNSREQPQKAGQPRRDTRLGPNMLVPLRPRDGMKEGIDRAPRKDGLKRDSKKRRTNMLVPPTLKAGEVINKLSIRATHRPTNGRKPRRIGRTHKEHSQQGKSQQQRQHKLTESGGKQMPKTAHGSKAGTGGNKVGQKLTKRKERERNKKHGPAPPHSDRTARRAGATEKQQNSPTA